MAHYQGMKLSEMIQYILSVCKSRGYSTNRSAIVKFLNEANLEFDVDSEFNLTYFSEVTVADANNYGLPNDLNILHDVFIQETGEEGEKPLKPTTLKKIKATLANDDATDVIEP